VSGSSTNFWGDAGADSAEEALLIVAHRVRVVGDADASEIRIRLRGVGEPRDAAPVSTIRLADCDRDFGLRESEIERVRGALGRNAIAPNIDVIVTFEGPSERAENDFIEVRG
jgi:hypothetical protein